MEDKEIRKIICVFENDIPFIYTVRKDNSRDVAATQSIYKMLQAVNAAPDGFDNFVAAYDTGDNINSSIIGTCGNCLALIADVLTELFVDSRFVEHDLKTGFEAMVELFLQEKSPLNHKRAHTKKQR